MATREFIVAIELGSSKVTGIAGEKNPDGSIHVLAMEQEPSASFIQKGVVYNIDKTAKCLEDVFNKLQHRLKTEITQVYVGVGGQSIRGIMNVVKRELGEETRVTKEIVTDLDKQNRASSYADKELIDVAVQEYRVGQQLQTEPVGVATTSIEGNYLNIVQRKKFFNNFNQCFDQAGVPIAEFYLSPITLAASVLTEPERRSGCALVDIGADTTTVCIYMRNILRHLVVIPLGSANITRDIETVLRTNEADAEQLKLKYGSATMPEGDIDATEKYRIDTDREVESLQFANIVYSRSLEIVENVLSQLNGHSKDLLGGLIITGGGSNLKNIEQLFRETTNIDKVRVAKTINATVTGNYERLKKADASLCTVLSLLARGDKNCAGDPLSQQTDIFSTPRQPANRRTTPRTEVEEGVVISNREKEEAEERERQLREAAEREAEQKRREEEAAAAKAEADRKAKEEEERRQNSVLGKIKRGLGKFVAGLTEEED